MRFTSNKNDTPWKRWFAWRPVHVGKIGNVDVKVWMEWTEVRYIPKGDVWANAVWECRPLNAPKDFVPKLQFEGQWV